MNRQMQGLIAAACIAVIAGVGYYVWGEFSSYRARVAEEAEVESVRAELFDLAEAKSYEPEKVRMMCARLREKLETELKDNDMAKQAFVNCRVLRYAD
ncbi:hypothetical protein X753_20200 [Mesorhizobium sp. LNJC399B00]|uniref:hypothetical protein n=1 Tax=unclassified Mesorhizobium TaxID=325217 RepID=UPI0003CE8AF2|nr:MULTISPECIES: hypothetical protein [unclassified Mesorhizobium]ESY03414.1 hypothetical protein X753_20200 [Mesorhizobium sp. LNJC399B00]WJI67298.1 hypothetical protein NLY36_20660 [Mesorhizobium sp. C399B]